MAYSSLLIDYPWYSAVAGESSEEGEVRHCTTDAVQMWSVMKTQLEQQTASPAYLGNHDKANKS